MKEITLIAKNEMGSLAAVAEALGSHGVNIEAISAYGERDNAIFRIITNDTTTALKAISKVPGLEVLEGDTILYSMLNRPGELGKITRKLANKGVNLESLYIVSRKLDHTDVAIKPIPADIQKAKDALGIK
ncbi:ACT domain-containing protein [Candidatus Micrarchaeota archaeon]|nr:ACT domain-containing protein [Candidatus Micrarchaeota archaeon]